MGPYWYKTVQCNKPRWLYEAAMHVPCGRCRACRIAKSSEWTTRIIHELEYHPASTFATLTYKDDRLPENQSVCKDTFQRFMKRLRKGCDDRKIRYFGCGEYGENFGRPHYHAILFGIDVHERDLVNDAWQNGFVKLGTVTKDSARYVADYVQKDNRVPEGREPPFSLKSGGLGRQFALDNAAQLVRQLGCTLDGVPVGLPLYYKRILEIPTEDLYDKAEIRNAELANYYTEKYGVGYAHAQMRSREQKERNLKAQAALYSKGNL